MNIFDIIDQKRNGTENVARFDEFRNDYWSKHSEDITKLRTSYNSDESTKYMHFMIMKAYIETYPQLNLDSFVFELNKTTYGRTLYDAYIRGYAGNFVEDLRRHNCKYFLDLEHGNEFAKFVDTWSLLNYPDWMRQLSYFPRTDATRLICISAFLQENPNMQKSEFLAQLEDPTLSDYKRLMKDRPSYDAFKLLKKGEPDTLAEFMEDEAHIDFLNDMQR